uniref:Uncharacterized protein n=1 Tax=Anguilla anguilla TaxID=7936 RepID=A0A0E9W3Q3_ANGAN
MHPAAVVDGGGSLRSVGTFSSAFETRLGLWRRALPVCEGCSPATPV